ncbi:GroES-like protein [Irpex lacteus]|nr:GroES-like protein [Irpex lacteus]
MSTHKALLLLEKNGEYAVRDVPTPKPGPGQLLIEVRATALNPADWKRHDIGVLISEYPAILGIDAAGVVKAVGEGVTNFAVGDRVIYEGWTDSANSTFQQYLIAPADVTAKLPSNISFEEGASIPLGLTTAAFGLYYGKISTGELRGAELVAPWEAGGRGKYAGQPILVVGGSSSVGQYVIQLAKLSGFSPIITTASTHNTELLKSLGATHVIDRHLPLAPAVKAITSEPINVVYDAIATTETAKPAFEIVATGGTFINVNFGLPLKDEAGKRVAQVFGMSQDPAQYANGVSLWQNITKLLESGEIKPNKVEIVPNGLSGIPDSLEKLKADKVSGKKLIAQPWA